MERPIKKIIVCPYLDCEYSWETMSQMKFVTCPSCLRKIEVDKNGAEDD